MKKILLIFSLILGIFCRPAFASEIDLENIDAEYVFVGGSATVTFDVFQGQPNQSYKYMFFGGPNNTSSINTFNSVSNQFLSPDNDWALMPSLTTNSNGYSRVEGIFSVRSDKNFCSSIDDYCYQLYVGIYNTTTAQEDSHSVPQEFVVLPTNYFSFTPTPIPITSPSFSPTSRPSSITSTLAPTSIVSSTNSSLLPTMSPTPTIDPTKFKTTASSSAGLITPTSTLFDNNDNTNSNLTSIQTGSNPEREKTEILGIHEPTFISNLGVKIFFIFLLTSLSFTLYCLCFFGYTLETLLPEINHLLSIIKPYLINILLILKKISKIIYQYFQTFVKAIKTTLYNSQIIKKFLKLISQKLLIFSKICLKISQKTIKYFGYLFNQFFIFIKNHIHIKIPRKVKRYLYHKRNHTFGLIFLVLISSLLIVRVVKGDVNNSYLWFDGVNDYVQVPDNNAYSVPTTGELTVSFWMRPDVLDFQTTIASGDGPYIDFLGKGEYSGPTQWEWNFRMYNDIGSSRPNRVSFYLFNIDGGIGVGSYFQGGISGTPTMVAGEWVHVVGKIDSTYTRIYRNGALKDTDDYTASITPQNGTAPFRIGTVSTTDFSPFKGAIDDVIIWNRALSDTEITNLYGGTVPATGIVGRWMFDEGVGNTASDDISTNDGTLIGQPEWAPSSNSTVTSATYTINNIGDTAGTITNIPFGTSKADFQAALTKGQFNQTWDITRLADPVVTGNSLVVTAEDTSSVRTYTLTVSEAPINSNGILVFVANGSIFKYKLWDGSQFGTTLPGPTLSGNGTVRHVASAVSDDGDYVGVVAEVYNTGTTGVHGVYGTVWDVNASQWINTSLLWSFTDTTADNIHQRYFDITALGNDEFVVVGKEDPDLTLNNAGWLAGTGWTQETDLTTIGSVGKFVELIRRPGTTNLLLCTTDEASDTNCRYYKGATPYGTSANINDDWTGNTEIMTLSDDPQNWDSHTFFDPTDNTRGAIIINPSSASGLTIRARRFTVTDTAITYGNTADSAGLSDDYARSLVAPIPGRSEALVLGAGILEDLKAYRVGVTAVTPNWTTITPNLEANAGLHLTTQDINFNWAMEFDGTRGIVAWAETGTANPVHFRRWTIDGDFEASEQQINGSPNNGYNRTMIARRDPVTTDEILFIAVNDDVDVSTAWWDGSANSFYTTGNKAWTEQATGLSTAIEDSFWSAEFQFFPPPNPPPSTPTLISPSDSATNQSLTPTFQTVTTDTNYDSVQYELKICTDSGMSANCQTFDQTSSNIGWSNQNVGTSAYASGTTATYVLQVGNSLTEDTTYYWKTRAKDFAGSGTWSSTQTTPFSFSTGNFSSPVLSQATYRWSDDDASGEVRSGVGDTWYDSNYDYRTPVTVTNSTGSTLTDFQVSISIGTSALIASGKMQSDCDDIRITDVNGNLLPHWIEENNPGCNQITNTKIWVKTNSLPTSDSTVYLYYGNSSASNIENGDNVFDFFENFNSGSLDTNTWTATGGHSLSGGEVTITTGSIYSKAPILQDSQNYIYEYRNKWSDTVSSYAGLSIANASYVGGNNSGSHKLVIFMCHSSSLSVPGYAADGTVASFNIVSGVPQYTATANTYYTNGFSIDSTNIRYYNNYSQTYSYTGTWSASPYLWLGYFNGSSASTTDIRDLTVDWVKVRKYASNEPTFTLGTETTEPTISGATWLSAENVGITGVSPSENIRLRFSIANTGANNSSSFRLQVAPKGGSTNCTDVASGNFSDVTTTIGSNLAVMTTTPNFTNQEATTKQLTDSSTTFIAGKMVEYDSNQSDSISLNTNEFTEIEYNFQLTNNVGATTPYCFRVTDAGSILSTYTNVAQVTTATPPRVSPFTPTLVSPSDSATGQSLTPTFKTVTTDANDDNLQYELKICTNSAMSIGCQTFDQINSNVGWSGQDIGTSAYSSGTTATYILQIGNSLAENTTYYWKTRAKDYAGTGTWSSTQTTPYSFTTNVRPNTPTLVSPGTGSTQVSQTPSLATVTTDTNNDSLQYKIELATDDAFTQNLQTFDLSSSSTGWSGINIGTSAYSSGTTATYTVQVGSSLAASTTYYWRSYAKDITGTTRWSSTQGTVFSFTTVSPVLVQATFRWSDDDASGEVRSIGAGDTWYDSNYDYRTPVTVTNNVGTSLTDFQTRLTIDTSTLISAGKMRSDCNDIRLTDNDKQTALSYYIERDCNTTSTVVWVKIPTLDASTTRDIYLYYGYTSATAVSNGDNTFDVHDDFDGTSIDTNKWHDWNPQSWGTVSISGGTLAINGTTTGGVEKSRGLISNDQFSFSNHIIEMNSRWITLGDINTNGYYQKTTAFRIGESYPSTNIADNNYNFLYIRYNGLFNVETTYYEFNKTISGSNSQVVKSGSISNNNPANFEIIKYHYYSGPNQKAYRSTNGGSSFSAVWTATNSNTISNYYGPLISAKQSTDGNTTTFFDWFRIRKYAATEPTFSLGTETTEPPTAGPSGATWLAAENVGITGVSPSENIRLRFSVANTGAADSVNFRLQVAPKGASSNCTDVASGNFSDVTTTIGSNLAVMTTSLNFTNQEATTKQLTDSSTTFVDGNMVEYASNQSDSISLNTNQFTEVEYNFQLTNNIGATTPYCFRVVDVDTPLATYTNIAQLTTIYVENNVAPSAPYLPYVNNTTAQSGQQSPVYGLIDHTPAFSAVFDDPNPANTASYYQLQIGSDSDWASAEIWDSTKTAVNGTCNENSRCGDIVYSGGTSLVDGSTYYWRLKYWDNLDVGGTWSDTLQFSMNNPPSVSNVVINGNNSINLSENSSIGVSWVATVTDADGYTNLDSATGKLYRLGVGQSCTPDDNNCYIDTSCSFENCSGSSCSAVCSANLYFFTEATDIGSTFVDQYYQAWIETTDIRSEIGSTISSSTTVDINTLSAFSIGQSLVYGEVFAGSDTGSSNTIVTITNTGNSLINLEIAGDYMCTDYPSCGGQNIEPHFQQYNLSTFTYGAGNTLSLSPTIVNVGISKPTQSPSNSVKNLYWGIGIPSAKIPGNYQGAVTILVD